MDSVWQPAPCANGAGSIAQYKRRRLLRRIGNAAKLPVMTDKPPFADRAVLSAPIEETQAFAPKFGPDGLIPAAATEAGTGRLLMLAYMNAQALQKTIKTGEAWYWSRSRGELWRKGAASGHTQRVVEIRTDCDQDALELVVEQTGPACHTARRSCFYRSVAKTDGGVRLAFLA